MTVYFVQLSGDVRVVEPDSTGRMRLMVHLPSTSEDTEFVEVAREDDEPMVGVMLSHGEAAAGYWPGGEDWSDEIRVPNPLGVFDG